MPSSSERTTCRSSGDMRVTASKCRRDQRGRGEKMVSGTISKMVSGTISLTSRTPVPDQYYCYNTKNQLDFVRSGAVCTGGSVSPAVTTLSYDVQGNLSNKNTTPYTFDFGNRLRTTAGYMMHKVEGFVRTPLATPFANTASMRWMAASYGSGTNPPASGLAICTWLEVSSPNWCAPSVTTRSP